MKKSLFEKLKNGLVKTKQQLTGRLEKILTLHKKIDEELFEELEEVLITADVGVDTTMELMDDLREKIKQEKISNPEDVKDVLKAIIQEKLKHYSGKLPDKYPLVIMVVGVNGSGKTTTIGKLAYKYREKGKKVLIGAGDTFRAAAVEQLEIWANRADAGIIKHREGSDPSAVIYDALKAAAARGIDVVICDTAGRLQTQKNLMEELKKIYRVITKEASENAAVEVLLVLDATTGQNALSQAKLFKEAVNVSGIALTKLDGTAKGGIILAVTSQTHIPVKLVGVGEGIEDLQEFDPEAFVDAIL